MNGIKIFVIPLFLVLGCSNKPINQILNKDIVNEYILLKIIDSELDRGIKNLELEINTSEDTGNISSRKLVGSHGTQTRKRNVRIIKTNSKGEFYLKKEMLNRIITHIYIPKLNRDIRIIQAFKDQFSTAVYRCGYDRTQIIGTDLYHLDSNYVRKIRLYEDVDEIEEFDKIKLYVCTDSVNKAKDFVSTLSKENYLKNQKKLWEDTWNEFKENLGENLTVNPNAEIWFGYVVYIMKRFRVEQLELQPILELIDETQVLEKKYDLLYAIFKIRHHHITMNIEEDVETEESLKNIFIAFYEKNEHYIKRISEFNSHGDKLMKKVLNQEKSYKNEGNIRNFPNVVNRLKMIEAKE